MLLVLHIIWTYFILKVLYRAILSGQVYPAHFLSLKGHLSYSLLTNLKMEKDSRSSSSEDFSEDNSISGNSSASPTTPSKQLPTNREHKNSK